MAGVSSSWRLERYARYITTNKSAVTGEWKYYKDSSTGQLVMTLTDTDYLVDGTRRFRVKFRASDTESASAICENASRKLSKFFPVKLTHLSPAQNADKNTVADESDKGADSSRTLNGEITIGHLAQVNRTDF
ncbi:hypothetical protein BaRGS_00023123 [Batillaria attramentaria]|uniref:Uncharacterized protein n=1 Tax=Batillaria attramentaria TaxID=370345 RepID=A0ABD0KEU1_9CAEN